MTVNDIDEMAIFDASDFEQDERSFQPLIYLEEKKERNPLQEGM